MTPIGPDDAYSRPQAEVSALQLEAAQELFDQRVHQIPLMARRAEDGGIGRIRRFEDLVPLLFAPTVYKSYPTSFIEKGQWTRMLQWLNTLSVEDTTKVDVSGVQGVDDWIDRLWAAGHRVLATSGSSGKCSFLNHTVGDQDLKKRHFKYSVGWPLARSNADRVMFWLGPIKGPNSAVEAAIFGAENWAKPGCVYALTDQPLKISEFSKMAAMRKAMAQFEDNFGALDFQLDAELISKLDELSSQPLDYPHDFLRGTRNLVNAGYAEASD